MPILMESNAFPGISYLITMKALSKSHFKLGLECPNKLFFAARPGVYANTKAEDSFLEALAQGGFQVEAMAQLHFPDGVPIDKSWKDYQAQATETARLLNAPEATVFEAGFLHEGLFARADIIVKSGNKVQLIEVKSKTYNPDDMENLFVGKRGGLVAAWKSYLFDIAFQKYVIGKCRPDWQLSAHIMMADKSALAGVDGLNQLFRIKKLDGGGLETDIRVASLEEAGGSVLGILDLNGVIDDILAGRHSVLNELSFMEAITRLREVYLEDRYAGYPIGWQCRDCEFRTDGDSKIAGMQSGFRHCFSKQLSWTDREFERPMLFDVRNFRSGRKLFEEENIHFMDELTPDMLGVKPAEGRFSDGERRWMQVYKTTRGDDTLEFDADGWREAESRWEYPLHFLDFEASLSALPFHRGMHPYEMTVFQYSIHTVHSDGRVEHSAEYLNDRPGEFPNFDLVRQLRKAVGSTGTIFKYSPYENTALNTIRRQLLESSEPDREELLVFIESITNRKDDGHRGERDMVDLWELIKKFYYNPLTNGSNSIKDVLPAVLRKSPYLQEKYTKPLHKNGLTSKNFGPDHIWLDMAARDINPYKLLPSIFGFDEESIEEKLSDLEDIREGGAAMIAYSYLQYTDMGNQERESLRKSLLKYCELDTLAMVMIWEHITFDLLNTH